MPRSLVTPRPFSQGLIRPLGFGYRYEYSSPPRRGGDLPDAGLQLHHFKIARAASRLLPKPVLRLLQTRFSPTLESEGEP
jgi:hypothetical protein